MFEINLNIPNAGCVFKNKETGEFYIKVNETDEYSSFVKLSDNYIYCAPEKDFELWTLFKFQK